MKLTKPEIKVKINKDNALSLLSYLNHLSEYFPEYMEPITKGDIFYYHILEHNCKSLSGKVINTIVKNQYKNGFKTNLTIDHAERCFLLRLVSAYSLPLDIEFINYELNKNFIK